MNALSYSVIAAALVSIISLAGILLLAIRHEILDKIVFYLVAISAGSLLGGAFLHLIPEAVEGAGVGHDGEFVYLAIIGGFILFFILERILHWHHCHKHGGECEVHTFSYLNLIGDAFHNFIDGLVLAAAFSLNIGLGIATTISVITHEIPQEISDFGVLIYGGMKKSRAILFNFLSATLAILGAVVGVFLVKLDSNIMPILAALTAGGFIYIASSDLIPELHKESKLGKSMIAFVCFLLGIALMFFLKEAH